MNWKNRLKNYNFWISMFSAVLLILQALKIKIDVAYINEIFTAVLGLLVVIGIISDPTRTSVKSQEKTDEKVSNTETTNNIKDTEAPLPIESKNEVGDVNIQNDFKTIVENIKSEISKTFEEMKTINQQTTKEIVEKQEQIVQPAVAETNTTYLDVIG